jgi:ABC-type polysaccharide/polyol phosphate export permease
MTYKFSCGSACGLWEFANTCTVRISKGFVGNEFIRSNILVTAELLPFLLCVSGLEGSILTFFLN